MPVRSLNSAVLRWPDKQEVEAAIQAWSGLQARARPDVLRIGYVGSYARDDWGVGSDLDVIVVIKDSSKRFEQRSLSFDLKGFPVPVDLMVYTQPEWVRLAQEGGRFWRTVESEAVWVYEREK